MLGYLRLDIFYMLLLAILRVVLLLALTSHSSKCNSESMGLKMSPMLWNGLTYLMISAAKTNHVLSWMLQVSI